MIAIRNAAVFPFPSGPAPATSRPAREIEASSPGSASSRTNPSRAMLPSTTGWIGMS